MNSHFPKMAADDLDFQRTALFLDVDGTLLDIAATPERVVVPGRTRRDDRPARTIARRRAAIVTGRTLADLDRLFLPLRTRAAGVHGAEIRFAPNEAAVESDGAAPLPDSLWRAFAATTLAFPGALAENKRYSFTAHYRAAPKAAAPLRAALLSLLERCATGDLELTDALCAYEIKSSGVNKGAAVRRFLERPPFVGRRPMFIATTPATNSASARSPIAAASLSRSARSDRKSTMCSPIRRRCGYGWSGSPPSRPLRERRDRAQRRHGFCADRQLPDRRSR